jgi:hypothetical protein
VDVPHSSLNLTDGIHSFVGVCVLSADLFLGGGFTRLIGFAGSTFVQWAAYLGNTSRVRLYIVDSPRRRQKWKDNKFPISDQVEWTHPELSSRIKYEVYRSEEAEKDDAKAGASR